MNNGEWALEIVNRAVLDWRLLIDAKAWKCAELNRVENNGKVPNKYCNFTELRRFFKGEWCELILDANGTVPADRILAVLERELADAIAEDEKKERLKA